MSNIISIEGFEYSGKSTQITLLKNYLNKNKIKAIFKREPGGLKDLEKIREIVVNSSFNNKSLILFFFASRLELINKISKNLKNELVVFDRFFDSTYAYQGINIQDKRLIKKLIGLIDLKFIPKLTFYLDINKETLKQRKNIRSYRNKFDQTYLSHFDRIKKNYLELLRLKINKRNYIVIDANKEAEVIHNQIIGHLIKWKLI